MAHRLYGSRPHGIAIGLLSTFAGLAFAELVVGLVRGADSPVVPVGQEVIEIVPPAVKDWAIDWFGTADKAVLILGTLLVLAVIGSLVGHLAVKGYRTAAYAVTLAVGMVGVFAVTMRPAPTFAKMLPPLVGTLVSLAVIWWLAPRATDSASDGLPPADPVPALRRRTFLQRAGSVGVLALVAGGLGRLLQGRFAVADERAALELPPPVDTATAVITPGAPSRPGSPVAG
ncbi:MAG TPA: hypothetical protein VIS05_05700, partial [Ilumatobacter sp.]